MHCFSLGGVLRGHHDREADFADLHSVTLEDMGYSRCVPLVLVLDHGKTKQNGLLEMAGLIRPKNFLTCPLSRCTSSNGAFPSFSVRFRVCGFRFTFYHFRLSQPQPRLPARLVVVPLVRRVARLVQRTNEPPAWSRFVSGELGPSVRLDPLSKLLLPYPASPNYYCFLQFKACRYFLAWPPGIATSSPRPINPLGPTQNARQHLPGAFPRSLGYVP